MSLKIVWNEQQSEKKKLSVHFQFTIYHSKSSCPIRLHCLLISQKFTRVTASLSLDVGRYSDEESVKDIWDFGASWNCCEMKILMMLSPSVKTSYLKIF